MDSSKTAAATPSRIGQHGPRALAITWADGHESIYDVRRLRLACGCAKCVDEWSGEERIDATSIPADVAPQRIQPVGRYAIQIDWSDGHQTGIYPFRRLRDLCDCEACRKRSAQRAEGERSP